MLVWFLDFILGKIGSLKIKKTTVVSFKKARGAKQYFFIQKLFFGLKK